MDRFEQKLLVCNVPITAIRRAQYVMLSGNAFFGGSLVPNFGNLEDLHVNPQTQAATSNLAAVILSLAAVNLFGVV